MLTPLLSAPFISLNFTDFGLSYLPMLREGFKSSVKLNPKKSELIVLKSYSMKNKAICLVRSFLDNSFNIHHGSYILIYKKNNQLFVLLEKMNKVFYLRNFNKPLNKIVLKNYMSEDLAHTCEKAILNFKLDKNLEEKASSSKSIKI